MTLPSVLCVLLCGAALIHAEDAAKQKPVSACCGEEPHIRRIEIRHIESGGIGYNQGYTTIDGFFAPDPSRSWTPFVDLRGHVFNDGKFAANAGIGARTVWGCRIFGANVYYDYRNTHKTNAYRNSHKLHYNQIGAGLETIGERWDVRVNGYFPVGTTKSDPYDAQFAGFVGNGVRVKRKYQVGMTGVDGEFGVHFGKKHRNLDYYAALGPYYFQGEVGKAAIGGKVRLAAYYKDYVTLELSDSCDAVFNNRFQGQLTLSMPLGPKARTKKQPCCAINPCTLAERLLQPVARQEIVVVSTPSKTKLASLPFSIFFVNNLSHSAGTFESPYPTLAEAQAASAPGDVIYVFPGDGTTNGMNSGIALQSNQSFWGSGVSHYLATNLGTINIPAQTLASPQMTNTGGDAITLADGANVSGFYIPSPKNNGIIGTSVGGISITDMKITNAGSYGIFLPVNTPTASPTFNLARIDVSGSTEDGINLTTRSSANAIISISDCSSYLNAANGITISVNDTSTVVGTIDNNYLSYNGFGGSDSGLTLITFNTALVPVSFTATNNTILGNDGSGVLILNSMGSLDVTLLKNTISENINGGISFSGAPSTPGPVNFLSSENTISGNSVSSGNGGIFIQTIFAGGNFSFGDTISANFGNGITIQSAATLLNINLTGCALTGNLSAGFIFNPNAIPIVNFNIANSSLSGNVGGGLGVFGIVTTLFDLFASESAFDENIMSGINIQTFMPGATNIVFDNCSVQGNGGGNGGVDISFDGSPVSQITCALTNNSIVGNSGSGVSFAYFNSSIPSSFTASGNSFESNFGPGIYLDTNSFTAGMSLEIDISSNRFLTNGAYTNASPPYMSGVQWQDFSSVAGVSFNAVFSDNTFIGNSGNGILISPQAGATSLVQAAVTNNTFRSNFSAGVQASNPPAGALCLDLENNTSDTGYSLSQTTGTFNIAPNGLAEAQNANLPNGSITTTGTFGACP